MRKLFESTKTRRRDEIVSRLDKIIDLLTDLKKDTLVGEAIAAAVNEHYTNDDMCRILRVSKRTLARYRQHKQVSYYTINGKVYYKVSEVQKFLKKKGKDAPDSGSVPSEKQASKRAKSGYVF